MWSRRFWWSSAAVVAFKRKKQLKLVARAAEWGGVASKIVLDGLSGVGLFFRHSTSIHVQCGRGESGGRLRVSLRSREKIIKVGRTHR